MLAVISDAADPSASQPRRRAYGGALRLTYGATVVVMAVRARVCLGLAFQVGGRRSREDWHPRGVDTASHAADSVHDEHREDGGQRRDRAATAPEIGGSVHVPTLRLRFVAGSVALRRPFPASFRREECPKGNDAWREASPGARNSSLPPPPSPDVRFGRRGGSPQLARIGPLLELLHDPGQLPDRGVVQPMRQGLGPADLDVRRSPCRRRVRRGELLRAYVVPQGDVFRAHPFRGRPVRWPRHGRPRLAFTRRSQPGR
jgi:hypothetical protein